MSNYHTPKKPTPQQLALMKDRYEVSGAGLVVKNKYQKSPEVGEHVGSVNSRGYPSVSVLGRFCSLHHIVWFLTHERWPEQSLDHIDGNKRRTTHLRIFVSLAAVKTGGLTIRLGVLLAIVGCVYVRMPLSTLQELTVTVS